MAERVVYELPIVQEGPMRSLGLSRFEKELLREGEWVHPQRKFRLKVTPERMANWIRKFKEMLSSGIKVPVPYGHSYDPKDNAGWLEELKLAGKSLMGVLNIPRTADAERFGTTIKDVSVSINPDFIDGTGKRWGEVIEHIAATLHPIVTSQKNFVALGQNGQEIEILRFSPEPESAALSAISNKPWGDVDKTKLPKECFLYAGEAEKRSTWKLPVYEGAGEIGEDGLQQRRGPLNRNGVYAAAAAMAGAHGVKPDLGDDFQKVAGLLVRLYREELKEEPTASLIEAAGLSQAPSEEDNEKEACLQKRLIELEAKTAETEVTNYLLQGKITPAMAAGVKRLLLVKSAISLSAGPERLDVAGEVRRMLEALPKGAAVQMDEKTAHRFEIPKQDVGMSDERAKALAEENRRLAKING
jgi:hypothetical protein